MDYKLYIYGNRKGIRSSRKFAESCKVNLEVRFSKNRVIDHGMLSTIMEEIKSETTEEILEVAVDNGYEDEKDLIKCLENGIIHM